jgi:plasmid stability protein
MGTHDACITHASLQDRMATLVQIRDLPDDVHRVLKARAAASGTSLSEYLRQLLARAASRPTPQELGARIEARGRVRLEEPGAVTIRHLRDRGEE